MSEAKTQLEPKKILLLCVVMGLAWAVNHFFGPFQFTEDDAQDSQVVTVEDGEARPDRPRPGDGGERPPTNDEGTRPHPGDAIIARAFRDKQGDLPVLVRGEIFKLLRDDNEGSRHQKFLIRLGSGRSLLIVHNIDIAPRVPAAVGDSVDVKGDYEWSDRGGLVHWTHRNTRPRSRHPAGWIIHKGKKYE